MYSLYNRHSGGDPLLPTTATGSAGNGSLEHSYSPSPLPSLSASAYAIDVSTEEDPKYRTDDNSFRLALWTTMQTVALAVLFGVGVLVFKGAESGMEYFAGYIVEQSLSVDNLFVFIMLFEYFKVPLAYQNRVLTWGIIGAVCMRGGMIYLGVAVLEQFEWMILIFAGILLFSAFKLIQGSDEEEDLSNNCIMRASAMVIPSTSEYDGDRFFVRENGSLHATPLLMCLVCIEFSDLVFAIDSIPAVIGISKDPFVVYSSNIFAIMGLRALYTVVAKAVADLPYLKPAVALVLGFVGGKMLGEYFKYSVSTAASLLVVVSLIGGGVLCSYCDGRHKASRSLP